MMVQHVPPLSARLLAERLHSICRPPVEEAVQRPACARQRRSPGGGMDGHRRRGGRQRFDPRRNHHQHRLNENFPADGHYNLRGCWFNRSKCDPRW